MAVVENIVGTDYFTSEDKDLTFTIYQADDTTLQDIAGWTLVWLLKARRADADADALVTKTTTSGIALTTPSAGVCTVTLTDDDIDALVGERKYFHELRRSTAGHATVLSYGSFTLGWG